MSTPKQRKRDKVAKIQAIVDTTRRMIEERGYIATTTNHIAKEANISVALLYKYFPTGKPGILQEIFEKDFRILIDEQTYTQIPIKDIPNFLEKMLLANIRHHRANARLIAALDIAYLTHPDLFQEYLDINEGELGIISAALTYLKTLGYGYSPLDINSFSLAIVSTIDSIVHRHVNFFPIFATDDELVHFLSDIILKMLGIPSQ